MHVGKRPDALPAAKRLAHVAPDVDLRECTFHLPPQKVNTAEPRGDIARNPKQGYQWSQKGTCVLQKLKNKVLNLI